MRVFFAVDVYYPIHAGILAGWTQNVSVEELSGGGCRAKI